MTRYRVHMLCAIVAVAVLAVVIAARPGISQPTNEDAVKAEIMRLQQQAVQTWLDLARQLEQDPLLLERGGEEAEKYIAHAEGLEMVLHRILATMDPRRREMEMPPSPGRFQFVEWDQEPMWYWVIDTSTGQLDRRQAPH